MAVLIAAQFILSLRYARVLFRAGFLSDFLIYFALVNYIVINLIVIFHFSRAYLDAGLVDNLSGNAINELWTAVYFSTLAWAGVNHGDITPAPAARMWVVSETIIGYVSMALLIGIIFSLLIRSRKKRLGGEVLEKRRITITEDEASFLKQLIKREEAKHDLADNLLRKLGGVWHSE